MFGMAIFGMTIFGMIYVWKSSETQVKTLAQDTIIANARFFGGNVDLVPKQVSQLTTNQEHQ